MDLSEIEKFETPAKTPKLSEAIRVGASLTPQCRGAYYDNGATCVWGAAAVGFGANSEDNIQSAASLLHRSHVAKDGFWPEVMTRNDCGESRESIADWLEGQGY